MATELIVLTGILGFWSLALTLAFALQTRHYRRLTGVDPKANLKQILDRILESVGKNEKAIGQLEKELARFEQGAGFYIQKIGIVRFNPFSETGGDHSFSLALLDRHETGLVMTGLHTRERTRIYVKPIKKGKSSYELSKEELKAVHQAEVLK